MGKLEPTALKKQHITSEKPAETSIVNKLSYCSLYFYGGISLSEIAPLKIEKLFGRASSQFGYW